jgi:phenylacetate-CoA ligase
VQSNRRHIDLAIAKVLAADGTVTHGLVLVYIVRDLAGVSQFKIVQESLDLTRVRRVCQRDRAGFKARLGQSVQLRVEWVSGITPEISGKFCYVVSRIEAI